MGRRTRTLLPTAEKLLKPSADQVTTRKNLEAQKRVQSMRYNRGTKNLPPLLVGDTVRMRLPGEQKWSLGVCTHSLGRRSYEVEVEGRTYRRNRRQLCSTPEPPPRNDAEEVIPELAPLTEIQYTLSILQVYLVCTSQEKSTTEVYFI